MARELTKKEIYERMKELRNLRKLHAAARERVEALQTEVRTLKQTLRERDEILAQQQAQIEDHQLQLEELKTMLFGKKKKTSVDNTDHDVRPPRRQGKKSRTKESYRRAVPEDDEVTDRVHHSLSACPHCGDAMTHDTTCTYYEEDIPLQTRIVRAHTVEQGHCATCTRHVSAVPIPPHRVVLGSTIKRYIVYLSVVCRLSYTQIQDILMDTYNLRVSEGEIARILEKQSHTLRPHYERLLASIRGEPSIHLDETGWNLFRGDGMRRYAWGMVGGVSGDTVYVLGKTRGKGNATDLLGATPAVVVSDDYGAYHNLPQPHQLCCAHILRKVRDLARSGTLTGATHNHCVHTYHTFADIYADIDTARVSVSPMTRYNDLLVRLRQFTVPHPLDPKKLMRVKKQVRDRITAYLTCLQYPDTKPDNNPAERALRHLVLKRKVSFGSLTEATAERLAVLTSVLMTYKQRGTLRAWLVGQ